MDESEGDDLENSMGYQRIVRFADTDAAGVVYFVNVLNFCHEAYEDALLDLGIRLPAIPDCPEVALPIIHAAVDFQRPLTCGEHLEITLHPTLIDPVSYEIRYSVQMPAIQKTAAQALTRHVCINPTTRQRHPLPEILQAWIRTCRDD